MLTIARVPIAFINERNLHRASGGEKARQFLAHLHKTDERDPCAPADKPKAPKGTKIRGSNYTRPSVCKRRHGKKG